MKKYLSVLVAAVLVFSLFAVPVMASGSPTRPGTGGSGNPTRPSVNPNPQPYDPTTAEEPYKPVVGNGTTYTAGRDVPLTFVFERQDKKDAEAPTGLNIDGVVLPRSSYDVSVKGNKVTIDINPERLDRLPNGGHTLTAVFADDEASVPFSVSGSSVEPQQPPVEVDPTIPAPVIDDGVRYDIDGGTIWVRNEDTGTIDFVIKRDFNGNREPYRLNGVMVDGKAVDPSDYTVSFADALNASSVVTGTGYATIHIRLHENFVNTLAPGAHVLTAVFSDGIVSEDFAVVERATPVTPAPIDPAIPTPTVKDNVGYQMSGGIELNPGESSTLDFAVRRTYTGDDADFELAGVMVDGKALGASAFTYEKGTNGVLIHVNPGYLKTLSVGSHTITAVFNDGVVASRFEVTSAMTGGTTPGTPATPATDKGTVKSPQTGSFSAAYALMGVVCMAGAAGIAFKKSHR